MIRLFFRFFYKRLFIHCGNRQYEVLFATIIKRWFRFSLYWLQSFFRAGRLFLFFYNDIIFFRSFRLFSFSLYRLLKKMMSL